MPRKNRIAGALWITCSALIYGLIFFSLPIDHYDWISPKFCFFLVGGFVAAWVGNFFDAGAVIGTYEKQIGRHFFLGLILAAILIPAIILLLQASHIIQSMTWKMDMEPFLFAKRWVEKGTAKGLLFIYFSGFIFDAMEKKASPLYYFTTSLIFSSLLSLEFTSPPLALFLYLSCSLLLVSLQLITSGFFLGLGLAIGLQGYQLLFKYELVTIEYSITPIHFFITSLPLVALFFACYRFHMQKDFKYTLRKTSPSLIKWVPFVNPYMFASLDVWLKGLRQARFFVAAVYIPRLIFLLGVSTLSTLLTLPERLTAPFFLKNIKPPPPVFILGIHRSGTTYLHQLLALDPQLKTPRLYHVFSPVGTWLNRLLIIPLFGWLVLRRPMDRVRLSSLTVEEEEHAIGNTCLFSPLWRDIFPKEHKFFDGMLDLNKQPESTQKSWMRLHYRFVQCLTLFSGKRRPLLKSPWNTGRVKWLEKLYPKAHYVHITRKESEVYASNQTISENYYRFLHLQHEVPGESYVDAFPKNWKTIRDRWDKDREAVDSNRYIDIHFNDLKANAPQVIQKVYKHFGWTFTEEYHRALKRFLAKNKGYKQNSYSPAPVTPTTP